MWMLRTRTALIALALIWGMGNGAEANEVTVVNRRIVPDGKWLLLNLRLKDVFSPRTRNAIEAGLTTALVVEFRLNAGQRRVVEKEIGFEIRHDIWEGQYLVLKHASPPDTLRTSTFAVVERFCTEMDAVELAPTDLLRSGEQIDLKFRIRVNTVSPEQARRTRQWLEPPGEGDAEDSRGGIRIDFGDVIDFFFNIYKPQERSGWIDLWTYTPRFTGQLILEEAR
ncbi:MAG: DUF4390 domain-containing protein [Candidatus Latescibacteria bacterium]|nr:DUF4390 domain-containing protein [Candidatus Latescibacterota bacterium]